MKRNKITCGLSCCALALAGSSGSALGVGIAYEGFLYAAGTPLPVMGGCCGWAAPWVGSGMMIAAPPTLSYPVALPSAGNALQNTAIGEGWRVLPGGVTNFGGDLWVSFMEQSPAVGGSALVSLDPSGAGFGTLHINKNALGAVTASAGGPAVGVGMSRGPGLTDFFVVRLRQFGGGFTIIDIYLNPAIALTAALPNVSLAAPMPFALGRFYYRSDMGQWLDEIRIGTMPGDVAAAIAPPTCYANCDQSTVTPCLNVQDFACFLNRFAAGNVYANCDGSTTPPVLNVLDFACYLNRFAAGCSSC